MPRINTTRTVKVALWALRVYLLLLLALIGFKFVRVFSSAQKTDPGGSSRTPEAVTNLPVSQAK